MIADDHSDMRRVLGNIVLLALEEPVELIECKSGEDAIAHYSDLSPDLVLMDIELKSMSGFDVTEQIYEQDAQAKVIIVTSYDTPTFRRKAKKLHTVGFVCKDRLSDLNNILQNIAT